MRSSVHVAFRRSEVRKLSSEVIRDENADRVTETLEFYGDGGLQEGES